MAGEIAVEGNAVIKEIADAFGSFPGDQTRDLIIDDAGARCDRVGGVLLSAIAFTDGCRNAALCPHARCAFAQRCCCDNGDGQWRKFQSCVEPSESRANDGDVARCRHRLSGLEDGFGLFLTFLHHGLRLPIKRVQFVRLTMRSTARRARSAISGLTVTSYWRCTRLS